MNFGRKLSKLLDSSGKRPADLSRASGVAQSTISNYRKGKKTPDLLRNALSLARTLGVSLDYLADDEANEPDPPMSETLRRAWDLVCYLGADEAMRRLTCLEEGHDPNRSAGPGVSLGKSGVDAKDPDKSPRKFGARTK